MGFHVLEKLRQRLINALDEKIDKTDGLERKLDVLREFVYSVVQYIDDEKSLELLMSWENASEKEYP